jgi:CheY-like chemotaxis protein/signal transduction histidine kinase
MTDTSRNTTYQNLASQAELALFQINSDNQLTFTSRRFERLLNWDEGELEGHLVTELAHPENITNLPDLLKQAYISDEGSSAPVTIKFQHKTRGWIACKLRCIAVNNASGQKTFLITTDPATLASDDRVVIELTQALCEQHYLAAIVDETSNQYLWANQNYLNLVELTQQELQDICEQGSHESPRLTLKNQSSAMTLKDILSQTPLINQQDITCTDPQGNTRSLTYNAISCKFRSRTFIIGYALSNNHPSNESAAGAQTHRNDILERLVNDIAHSFNNLLSIVSGHAAILEEVEGLEGNASFESIHQAVAGGAALIKQLSSLSVTKTFEPKVLNLGSHIEQMRAMIELAVGKSIRLSIVNDGGDWQCSIIPAEFQFALFNLCINAKETMATGGTLDISITQVTPASSDIQTYGLMAADYTKISIRSGGSGLSELTSRHIFKPFHPVLESAHLDLEKNPPNDSVLSSINSVFLVPADSEFESGINIYLLRDNFLGDGLTQEEEIVVFESKIKRALLLEDDQGVRELVSMFLQGQGFDVTEIASGEELNLLEDLNFDFMVSDVMLPGKEMGPDVVKKVRKTVTNLPVLFISGYSHGSLSAEDLSKPNTDFLAKPFSKPEFVSKIDQLLASPKL